MQIIEFKDLLGSDNLRFRLLLGCIGMAVVVSAIFLLTSYRLSSDMGKTLEIEALQRQNQLFMKRVGNFILNKEKLDEFFESIAESSAENSGEFFVYIKKNNNFYYSNSPDNNINSKIEEIDLADSFTGELDVAENNYIWVRERAKLALADETIAIDSLVFKEISSFDRALTYVAKRLSITAFLTFWGAVWAALIISAVIARRVDKSNAALIHMAGHDALTNLRNRASLIRVINDFLVNNETKKTPVNAALLLIDLNKFKEINDSLGHAFGDIYLIGLAKRLKELESKANVFRYGGDEFVVWVENITKDDVIKLADQLSLLCQKPILIDGEYVEVSASIGISLTPKDALTAESLLQNADLAMYQAKNMRRDYVFYEQNAHSVNTLRLKLRSQIATAIENSEFVLFFQPKINLQEKKIQGFEALVRWQHPHEGLLFPDIFIDLIEQSGIVHKFSRYILDKAICQAKEWLNAGKSVSVAVNLSPYNMADATLADYIKEKLDYYDLPARLLEIELTESATMVTLEKTVTMFKTLQKMGIKVSIDDFGTGMSSLAYLKELNVDFVKIDRSFINDMTEDSKGIAMVEGILSLCKHLKKDVVAEGVENVEQAELLLNLGCKYAQGYLFSKPQPAKAFVSSPKYTNELLDPIGSL